MKGLGPFLTKNMTGQGPFLMKKNDGKRQSVFKNVCIMFEKGFFSLKYEGRTFFEAAKLLVPSICSRKFFHIIGTAWFSPSNLFWFSEWIVKYHNIAIMLQVPGDICQPRMNNRLQFSWFRVWPRVPIHIDRSLISMIYNLLIRRHAITRNFNWLQHIEHTTPPAGRVTQ